jgi:dipeptidyl aminopeptidase/acylaminoacyl peptidase
MARRWLIVLGCAFLLVTTASAQSAKRPITLEDLWQAKRLGKPALSPDGKWVVVEVTSFAMDDNSSDSDLWLLATDGTVRRQLTTAKGKESGPAWSPDGKSIAFVAKRSGDVAQIHLLPLDGGEARQLSKMPMAPSGIKWAPDSGSIFCIASTWPDTPDDESYQKRAKARKDDKVQAYVIDDALYRYWDNWIADGKRPVLFRVDLATGKHKNLFAGLKLHLPAFGPSAESYDVAPDGQELCFTADSTPQLGMDFNLDLFTLSLKSPGDLKNVTADNPANDFNPAYKPDGKSIAFLRQTTKYFYADRQRVMLLERAGGPPRELTASLDRSVGSMRWFARTPWLFFETEDAGYHKIGMVNANTGKLSLLTKGFSDTGIDVGDAGVVALRSSFDFPSQLYFFKPTFNDDDKHSLKPTRLDNFNDELRSAWDLGDVDNVTYPGAGGADVQMWVVYPPKFDRAKKWPLLMVIHGGPHNGIATDFHYRWNLHLFASRGYVVACPNFHGSSGFGQKFTDSITGDMASKPFEDVMKATDHMVKQPYIDKGRTAAAGASYGGFMMSWINGHTDRFKALVCHAGVYNWHSMMASDVVRSRERPLGALPWGDQTKIDRQSPQRFAANFKTPTLVMHGEKDYRVPVTQGFEFYNTLRIKGVPARLVYFPDENHWIVQPQNARLWHREFFGWLEKHVEK